MAYLNPARIELQTQTTHELKNSTGFGYSARSVDLIAYPVTDLGIDSVDTEWGQLSAQHYRYGHESLALTYTVDTWTRGDFILAWDTTSTGELQQYVMVMDTNVPSIYS